MFEDLSTQAIELIKTDRWSAGINHDPRSLEIVQALELIDEIGHSHYFDWRTGGDGDNGETLAYQLDAYFGLKDKGLLDHVKEQSRAK